MFAAIVAAMPSGVAARDCPGAGSGEKGFVVERGERSKTEVFHADGHVVRAILRYAGKAVLETTQFEGLFDLERIDRGRRSVFHPKTELARFFPLKGGQKITAEFDLEQGAARVVQFSVIKSDALYVGPCKYDVLKIERSESRGVGRSPVFVDTDYYSPDLKLVLAKEYRDPGDRTTLIKYDRIYSIQP